MPTPIAPWHAGMSAPPDSAHALAARRSVNRGASNGFAVGPIRGFRRFLALASLLVGWATAAAAQAGPGPIAVVGRHFVDGQGRVVILRGVNISGNAKVPPFRHSVRPVDLDRLRDLGFNLIRLVFIWEAYEPLPGVYDDAYLDEVRGIAAAAGQRGLFTVIDVHQDGFSRFASRGAGDGFPRWAISPRGTPRTPDNGPRAKHWPAMMASDPSTYKSFADFFRDANGVRSRYLRMLARIAPAFASIPGVIGYDPINEPWGREFHDLAPLYRDAAAALRTGHPSAILFLEGHIATNSGFQSRLPRPEFGGVVYAPHYYRPLTLLLNRWQGDTTGMDRAFAHMTAKAGDWDAPLLVGEFGVGAEARNAGRYVAAIYDRLDDALASGAQWNYTPGWNPAAKDGWNAEDFNILDPLTGAARANFRPRPYPRRIAGLPLAFRYAESVGLRFRWEHRPESGETEVSLPSGLFPAGATVRVDAPDATLRHEPTQRALLISCPRAATLTLTIDSLPCPSPPDR